MKYIASTSLLFMTVALIICGILLWRRRKETGDYSRTIQALFSWVSAFFTFTFIFRTWAGTTTPDEALFEPEHIFIPILCQTTFFFYPLEVIRPTISRTRVYTLLFAPPASAGVGRYVCRYRIYHPIYLCRFASTHRRVQRVVPHTHPHHHAFLLFLTLPCSL